MRRIVFGLMCGAILTAGAARILGAGAPQAIPRPGDVITGHDLGFRVERIGDGQVTGTFVVRVNGEWAEADLPKPPSVIPARP